DGRRFGVAERRGGRGPGALPAAGRRVRGCAGGAAACGGNAGAGADPRGRGGPLPVPRAGCAGPVAGAAFPRAQLGRGALRPAARALLRCAAHPRGARRRPGARRNGHPGPHAPVDCPSAGGGARERPHRDGCARAAAGDGEAI
ncbi:MAG: hypothetical protein AVDCRST_MAG68-4196, partial [uncultured Gemmatimonadetes bacterium]